jgi:transposase
MTNGATANPRQQRGLAIAATQVIGRTHGGAFMVPSQSEVGRKYRVVQEAEGFSCACPDYELTGRTCKHGFAVEFFLRRETKPDGTVIETKAARLTYSQPWAAYNKAQTTEKAQFCTLLRDLVADVPSPEQKRGRPQLPLSDMIFAATYKVYSTVSGRRFMTDLKAAADAGMIDKLPHYNSIFNVLDRESLTPILQELITRAALPLKALETDFAVDSSGFGTQNFYRHFSAKYGRDIEQRSFIKVHALVGTKTNVVAAAIVTEPSTGDSPMLAPLVTDAASHFNIERLTADKAYASAFNFSLIESFGAQPLVPFKSNHTGTSASPTWNRLFHYFHFQKDEFLARYHRRSNVESTFSAMKRKFGDTIRSKSPVAQRNEALLKVLCHNIVCLIHEITESGATPMFPALEPVRTNNLVAAQQIPLLED